MYKMIIIDDEYLVRLGLKTTIDWAAYNIEIVGEASNGKAGYELVCQLKPDIVISDVIMPIMNGIELVKKLKMDNFLGETIILSGHRDFDYARESFENGIFSYILKPIDNDELLKVVQNAIESLEKKRKQKDLLSNYQNQAKMVSEEMILSKILFCEQDSESELIEKLNMYNLSVICPGIIVVVDSEDKTDSKKILEKFKNVLDIELDIAKYAYNCYEIEDLLVYFIKSSQNLVNELLQKSLIDFSKVAYESISIGLGVPYSTYCEIAKNYAKVVETCRKRIFLGVNLINRVDEVETKYKKNLLAALEIVSKNYDQNLTVKYLADALLVSESYIMHLFKDSLGTTFIDVLTKHRVLVAKSLLLKGNYRVKEVAAMVGYNDVKYFSFVFKKETNCTPSQFMSENL